MTQPCDLSYHTPMVVSAHDLDIMMKNGMGMRYAEGIQNYSDRSCQTIYSVSSDLGPIQAGSKEQR